MQYDYLIVGAGLFGATLANRLYTSGKKVLVVEKKDCIGGACRTEEINGIDVHKYGPHIFHTNMASIWNYVNKFVEFEPFINAPLVKSRGELFNLPFNMNTFSKLWGVKRPVEAEVIINEQKELRLRYDNVEALALSMIGANLYERFIKGYTEKQWGKSCKELPASILKRIPVRYTYDNHYYNDRFQGVPKHGYTQLISNMLHGIDVQCDIDGNKFIENNPTIAKHIIHTGMIDEYFDYQFGRLEYRSLMFIEKTYDGSNYQGNAVINYADEDIPYTRSVEHCHFLKQYRDKTIITYEIPVEYDGTNEPYYPVPTKENLEAYQKYLNLAEYSGIIFCGRLGGYEYANMDTTIENAFDLYNKLMEEKE